MEMLFVSEKTITQKNNEGVELTYGFTVAKILVRAQCGIKRCAHILVHKHQP